MYGMPIIYNIGTNNKLTPFCLTSFKKHFYRQQVVHFFLIFRIFVDSLNSFNFQSPFNGVWSDKNKFTYNINWTNIRSINSKIKSNKNIKLFWIVIFKYWNTLSPLIEQCWSVIIEFDRLRSICFATSLKQTSIWSFLDRLWSWKYLCIYLKS